MQKSGIDFKWEKNRQIREILEKIMEKVFKSN